MLAGREGEVRVVLGPGREGAPALEPGEWRLRNTWLERGHEGEAWFLSASGPPAPPVRAEAGKPFRLEVADAVAFEGSARLDGGVVVLGFSLRGDRRRGISLWRDGRRVPVGYALLGPEGEVLARGEMTYG